MKNAGKARRAAWRMVFWTLVLLLAVFAGGVLASVLGALVAAVSTSLFLLWAVFVGFTLYFFRDPDPHAPSVANALVAPAHGKVDMIDEIEEPTFMGGPCKRLSIFLSIFDVHVQKAPVSARIDWVKENPGQFLSATRADSATHNENIYLGLVPTDYPDRKVGVRLIAGLIARRIQRWVERGETVSRSERISLIQYGSRVELYLPLSARIHVQLGTKVKGGETIVASFE